MDHFNYRDHAYYAEDVALQDIAKQYGTPCYVYSRATLERHWHACNNALENHPHLICYAVKACSNIAVLNLFARLGSGFDVVSVGELERVLKAGGDAGKVVFSGVAKRQDEIERALAVGINCFNVESLAELKLINQIAQEKKITAPIALRVNPDVDAKTHPYISTGLQENKFGIALADAKLLLAQFDQFKHLKLKGLACHIGSQITTMPPFLDALDRMLHLIDYIAGYGLEIEHLDLGGGLGVKYYDEDAPHPSEHAKAIQAKLTGRKFKLFLEPGRAIAANAGILLTRVLYLKSNQAKKFAIVDAGMNDLLRPALYSAWHDIVPVVKHKQGDAGLYDVVGPVCETADFLAKDRALNLRQGDLLAVRSAGAYGFSMASNYNARPRCAEVMVDGGQVHLIRAAERIEDLFKTERCIP